MLNLCGGWCASEWKKVYRQNFPKGFWLDQSNKDMWREYLNIPDEMIWGTRMYLKKRLIDYIRHKFQEDWMKSHSRYPGIPLWGLNHLLQGVG